MRDDGGSAPGQTDSHGSHAPAQRFVIVCWPRSGSYLMVELMNQLPRVLCHGEVFKPARVEVFKPLADDPSYGTQQRDADPVGFLQRVLNATPDRLTGFKLFWAHDRRAVRHVLGDIDTRLMFLVRNPVDMYVSLLNARATGTWIKRKPGPQGQAARLHFDLAEFDRQCDWVLACMRRALRLCEVAPERARFVGYEELDDPGIREIAGWLGTPAPEAPIRPSLMRQVTTPMEALLDNHAEMAAHVDRRFPGLRTATGREWIDWVARNAGPAIEVGEQERDAG